VTTPAFSELLTAIRSEGEAVVAAAQDLDVPVPTCGDWTMKDLLLHLASVYQRAAKAVAERATQPVPWEPPGDEDDPVGCVRDARDELVHALSEAGEDSPAWNWWGHNQTASFWARRMAHESAVHRFDAQRANDVAQPIDADLAQDGIDELIDLIVPRVIARDEPKLPEGSYTFAATDEGTWHVRFDADGLQRVAALKDPDVIVRGTASALLLAAYARVPWTSLDVDGNATLLDEWSSSFKF
jgi:uncharacterized protein (TIGR03083 family)